MIILDIMNTPSIPGIFRIPGPPIVGNLLQVSRNPAKTYMSWQKYYNRDIFQVRLGSKPVVIVNSFCDIQALWVKQSLANNSRPVSFTFHHVVSATQGFTVGSTPLGALFSRKKKVLGRFVSMNQISSNRFNRILHEETDGLLARLDDYLGDFSIKRPLQMFILRTAILLAYGLSLDYDGDDKNLCQEIVHVENHIIRYRSPTANKADYFPFLRYFSKETVSNYGLRRNEYMNYLFEKLKDNLETPDCRESIIGTVLLGDYDITQTELQSICLTFVSAGLDNTPLNLCHLIGHFSQPYGQDLQQRAFSELLSCYNGSRKTAWESVSSERKCDYILALINETLRYFTVLPLSLPRETTKPIYYRGLVIPAHTTLIMNAFAANHDESVFANPYAFCPERWLNEGKLRNKKEITHFAFGAGSRECSGIHLAIAEMYAVVSKIVLKYRILGPLNGNLMSLDPFESNEYPEGTSFEPFDFEVRLERRSNI